MSDIVLQEGQVLMESWIIEFKGRNRVHRPVEEWVECRVVRMYHGTIYGGATGVGKTVEEARLEAVLGLARAITDDVTAFDHDADEIFKAEQLRWFLAKIEEVTNDLDEEEEDAPRKSMVNKYKRRIKLLEQLVAEWQEEHDYWPEEATADSEERITRRAARIREDTARRRAASARISALAAQARANVSQPAGCSD